MRNSDSVSPLAVSAKQAAKMIGVCPRHLWSLSAPRGPIPVCRVGGRVVYRVSDLQEYLDRLAEQSRQEVRR